MQVARMEGKPAICSSCEKASAVSFCLCELSGVLLCATCLPAHFTRDFHKSHVTHPIQVFAQRNVPGYFDRLQQRCSTLPLACEELRRNLLGIEACIEKLNHSAELLISAIRKLACSETDKLTKLKVQLQADIDQSIAEAQRTLYEDAPALYSRYGHLLRTCEPARLKLFKFHLTCVESQNLHFILDLTYDCTAKSWDTCVPQLLKESLLRHNLLTGETTAVPYNGSINACAVLSLISPEAALCVGGQPAVRTVHSLSLVTAKATEEEPTIVGRDSPGIIKQGQFVYLFGGGDNFYASEKFSLANRRWTRLGDTLSPVSHFSPCASGFNIYLPEVCKSNKTLQAFNTLTENYRLFPISFPELDGYSVAFIFDEEEMVVIAGNRRMATWRCGSTANALITHVNIRKANSYISAIQPVHKGDEVIWIRARQEGLVKFSRRYPELTEY